MKLGNLMLRQVRSTMHNSINEYVECALYIINNIIINYCWLTDMHVFKTREKLGDPCNINSTSHYPLIQLWIDKDYNIIIMAVSCETKQICGIIVLDVKNNSSLLFHSLIKELSHQMHTYVIYFFYGGNCDAIMFYPIS